jgi:hypothetical protein
VETKTVFSYLAIVTPSQHILALFDTIMMIMIIMMIMVIMIMMIIMMHACMHALYMYVYDMILYMHM